MNADAIQLTATIRKQHLSAMNRLPISTPEDAIQRTKTVLAEKAVIGDVSDCLRFKPSHTSILSGRFGHNRAIFRLALSEKDATDLAETWHELNRIASFMSEGKYQAPRGLAYYEDTALLITTQAKGEVLLPLLRSPDGMELVHHIAKWLEDYSKPTIEWRDAKTAFWLKQAEKASSKQPHQALRAREIKILAVMRSLASRLNDQKWRVAITHGDYHPNNLLWDGETLTGIDIGGSAYLPIYKDMARTAVHLSRREILNGYASEMGVNANLLAAFDDSFELTEFERQVALPFFIGFECLIKVEQPNAPNWRIEATERFYDKFLADTRNF